MSEGRAAGAQNGTFHAHSDRMLPASPASPSSGVLSVHGGGVQLGDMLPGRVGTGEHRFFGRVVQEVTDFGVAAVDVRGGRSDSAQAPNPGQGTNTEERETRISFRVRVGIVFGHRVSQLGVEWEGDVASESALNGERESLRCGRAKRFISRFLGFNLLCSSFFLVDGCWVEG